MMSGTMTQKIYAIVTNLGAAKIANAVSLGTKLNITHKAVATAAARCQPPRGADKAG